MINAVRRQSRYVLDILFKASYIGLIADNRGGHEPNHNNDADY